MYDNILFLIKSCFDYAWRLPWTLVILFIIYLFKKEFRVVISSFSEISKRISNIKHNDTEVSLTSGFDSPEIRQSNVKAPNKKYFEFYNAHQSPIVTKEEIIIRNQLVEFDAEQAVDVLVKQLAFKNMQVFLLFLNKTIYLEQVDLLKHLNNRLSSQSSELKSYYDNWLDNEGDKHYSFESFLGFLIQKELIQEQTDGNYGITTLGKEYLKFLVDIGEE
jgi:hypothetical protein